MRRKKAKSLSWRKWLVIGAAMLVVALLLTYRLDSLPGNGLSAPELRAAQHSRSWHAVVDNPLFLPVTGLQRVLDIVTPFTLVTTLRLTSVIFGLGTFSLVAYVLMKWYGPRTAIFGCLTVATSAWFLHVARSGGVEIAYFAAFPLLLASHVWLDRTEHPSRVLPVWLVAMGVLLYIPGLVWFVVLNAIWQRQSIQDALDDWYELWPRLGLAFVGVFLLIPLVWGVFQNPILHYSATWMGLPTAWPGIMSILHSASQSLLFVSLWTPSNPALWLAHLPVLDVFLSMMLVAGIYFYVLHRSANRSKLLLASFGLGVVLVAIQGVVTRSLLVPLLYLVAAGGIAYILHLWLRIFPRNPLARTLGIGLVLLALVISSAYSLRQYFIAWPHHPDTAQAFHAGSRLGKNSDDSLLY
ncbi:hypothetical protein KDA23_06375 [Candidatus Saccharibacteria bacterium]|nr:hypothetical protein [Candidatus Saccharibacteria bacterium]